MASKWWDDGKHGQYEDLIFYRKGNGSYGHTRFKNKKVASFNVFDIADLDKLIDGLAGYKDSLEPRTTAFMNTLAEYGSNYAKATLYSQYGIDPKGYPGSLYESVHSEPASSTSDTAYVVADSEHAEFVEYGTGAMASGGRQHDSGEGRYEQRTSGGWVYAADIGPYHGFFTTYGQEARPFMYETSEELQEAAPMIAQEFF